MIPFQDAAESYLRSIHGSYPCKHCLEFMRRRTLQDKDTPCYTHATTLAELFQQYYHEGIKESERVSEMMDEGDKQFVLKRTDESVPDQILRGKPRINPETGMKEEYTPSGYTRDENGVLRRNNP